MNDKVLYWLDLCEDDLLTAKALFSSKRLLHMGFFCHMVVEKAIKATVTNQTNDIPPKIHDLQKLAVLSGIFDKLSDEQLMLMDKLTPLQIKARYPEYKEKIEKTLTIEYCERLLTETEAFLCWIKRQLGK